jgi:hypothetical protein
MAGSVTGRNQPVAPKFAGEVPCHHAEQGECPLLPATQNKTAAVQ